MYVQSLFYALYVFLFPRKTAVTNRHVPTDMCIDSTSPTHRKRPFNLVMSASPVLEGAYTLTSFRPTCVNRAPSRTIDPASMEKPQNSCSPR